MPPSSVAARSLALAVIGVGAASFAAHGQNVTAFNPYSGAGLTGGPLPQYTAPPAAPAAAQVSPGPAFNPWSSRTPAVASRPAAPPQASAPARQTTAGASLPPPPPGPIKSRVVAVPELPTSRDKSRDVQKASATSAVPAAKSASARAAPAPVTPAPMPTPAAPAPVPVPPVAAVPPPETPAVPPRQMAAVAPTPSAPARSNVAATLVFTARSTELSDASKVELDRLAKDLADRTLRQVELRSVSENGDPDGRKISLARALIVRNYLIDKGVRSRIEIASIVGGGGERVEIVVPST
jgi:outer membrane protein OmpA-like peptidoglycan-associated protein